MIHNIRNALNAFTLTSGILEVQARSYKGPQLREAKRLLEEWDSDRAAALASDPQGRVILERLDGLADDWMDEARELLLRSDGLRRAADHVAAVVAKQQEYAKPAVTRELCAPSDIIRDAAFLAASSRRRIDVVERHECSAAVLLDRHRVLQIVTNLIRNAEESVVATGRANARIEVSTTLAADRLRIAVSDDGLGLGPRAMSKLFEYGFTTKKHGHGFGLHSCKLLMDEMGGTIACASEGEGRGATFTLEIPIERRERAPLGESSARSAHPPKCSLAGSERPQAPPVEPGGQACAKAS